LVEHDCQVSFSDVRNVGKDGLPTDR